MSDNKKIYQGTSKVPETEEKTGVEETQTPTVTPDESTPTFEEALAQDDASEKVVEEVPTADRSIENPVVAEPVVKEPTIVAKPAEEASASAPPFVPPYSTDTTAYARDNYGSTPKKSSKVGAHAAEPTEKRNRKPLIIGIIAVVVVLIGILIGVGVSNALEAENKANIEYYQTHIFDRTSVGGVDVSKMSAEEAAEAVNSAVAQMSATVKDGEVSESFTAADAGVSEVSEKFFEDIISGQDSNEWKSGCSSQDDLDMPELTYNLGTLEKKVATMDCVSGANRTEAVDAQLKMENGEFEIVPGKEGNRVDADTLTDLVLEQITGGAYSAEKADSNKDSARTKALDAVNKAKQEFKEIRASYTDEDKDGWDDARDVIIADELAQYQAKIDEAQAALDAIKSGEGGTDGSYAGKMVKVDGVKVSMSNRQVAPIDVSQYYEQPVWTGEEEQFQAAQDKARKWLGAEIDYTIDMIPHAAKVDNKVIQNFIVVNQDNIDVELDEDAIKAWLHETCKDYDTVGTERQYTTPGGETITLSGGHYGWMTDEAAELPKLVASIEAGETVSRDMSYESEARGPKGGKEWGDTYIDIDITAQTVSYVQNGSVVFSARTVTGSEDGKHYTKRGFQSVLWKDSPHVMVGEIVPSTGKPEYETPCTYFILFNYDGSACHDADHIRSNWSTSAHLYGGGSHGCANMHYSDVQELWNLCSNGDPVIVHD